MATVTSYTAARMKAIEDASVISGAVVGDDLILTKFDASTVNAGNVRGPIGLTGPGAAASATPIADAGNRFTSTNVEGALAEAILPVGSFIFGGWTSNPTGYLLVNGQTVVNGALTFTALAAMFPGWISGNNLILPDATGSVPMVSSGTPGVVSGSMTHVLIESNMPAHTHTTGSHTHTSADHTHNTPDHQHYINGASATTSSANQDLVRRLAYGGSGFWTGLNSSPVDDYLDINSGGALALVWAGMHVDSTIDHQHSVSGWTDGAYNGAGNSTYGANSGTGNTTNGQGASNTGPSGAAAAVSHTPRNIAVRMAVKT